MEHGALRQALEHHQKALAIQEEVLDANHPNLVTSYNNIGATYWIWVLTRPWSTSKTPWRSEEVLDATSDLAILQQYWSDVLEDEALRPGLGLPAKSLGDFEEVLDAKHPSLATSYGNIGSMYVRKGATKSLESGKASPSEKKSWRQTHPDLATSYNNIGVTYWSLVRYEEALEYFQKALAIEEEALDATHPSLADFYNNIGATYSSMGRYDQALSSCKKPWQSRKKSWRPHLLWRLLQQYRKYVFDWGIRTSLNLPKSLGDPRKSLGCHPSFSGDVLYLDSCSAGLQQYKTTQDYVHKALAIFKEKKHPRIIDAYGHMGHLQLKLKKYFQSTGYFSLYNELAKDKDKALGLITKRSTIPL